MHTEPRDVMNRIRVVKHLLRIAFGNDHKKLIDTIQQNVPSLHLGAIGKLVSRLPDRSKRIVYFLLITIFQSVLIPYDHKIIP